MCSYWFSIKCFFGQETCDLTPGLRGSTFIIMYVISYIGSGLLLRYAEGATYLAIVQVSNNGYIHVICYSMFLVTSDAIGCIILEHFFN